MVLVQRLCWCLGSELLPWSWGQKGVESVQKHQENEEALVISEGLQGASRLPVWGPFGRDKARGEAQVWREAMLNWRCLQTPRRRGRSTIGRYLGRPRCPLPLPSLGGWRVLSEPSGARSGCLPHTYPAGISGSYWSHREVPDQWSWSPHSSQRPEFCLGRWRRP